ncbi:unnamed protein product [Schistosoma turkestanicum]|nr:unnamed protein product [Schistosoma turkestanicum]
MLPNVYTFCEANRFCYEQGLSVGKRLKLPVSKDLPYILGNTKLETFWLEYNALFTPRMNDSVRWQYHSSSVEIADLQQTKNINFPLSGSENGPYCMIHTEGSILKGVHCNSVNHVICIEANIHVKHLSGIDSSILLKKFTIEQEVKSTYVSMHNQTDGCYELSTKQCLYSCILQWVSTK